MPPVKSFSKRFEPYCLDQRDLHLGCSLAQPGVEAQRVLAGLSESEDDSHGKELEEGTKGEDTLTWIGASLTQGPSSPRRPPNIGTRCPSTPKSAAGAREHSPPSPDGRRTFKVYPRAYLPPTGRSSRGGSRSWGR